MTDVERLNIETNHNKAEDINSRSSDFIKANNERKLVEIKIKSKLAKVKCVFLEWSQSVTYHCFPKIFKEKMNFVLRLIWSLIFLVFASFTFFILVNNIIFFYKYETVTSIQKIYEELAIFPTLTICDSNAFTTKKAESLILDMSQDFYGINITNLSLELYQSYVINNLSQIVKSYVSDPSYGDENRQLLGFNLSQILFQCSFSGYLCNFSQDFHWYFHAELGNCFQFNSGLNMKNQVVDLKNVSFGTISNGLSVQIGPLVNQNQYPLTNSKGLKVFVHNETILPTMYDNSISIESGKETSIMVSKQISSNLPLPYNSCSEQRYGYDLKFSQVLANSNRTYRQVECLELCLIQKHTEENCNCYSTTII